MLEQRRLLSSSSPCFPRHTSRRLNPAQSIHRRSAEGDVSSERLIEGESVFIDFAAVTDSDDEHDEFGLPKLADNAIVAQRKQDNFLMHVWLLPVIRACTRNCSSHL